MQSLAAWVLQAGLHRSSGAKKRRHQDDKAEWHAAIPESI